MYPDRLMGAWDLVVYSLVLREEYLAALPTYFAWHLMSDWHNAKQGLEILRRSIPSAAYLRTYGLDDDPDGVIDHWATIAKAFWPNHVHLEGTEDIY